MPASKRSGEGYVRIPRSDLGQLYIEHLMSEIDPSIALPNELVPFSASVISGFTEWVGTWQGQQASFGWDWAARDGGISLINVAELRTNVQLLAASGAPESALSTRLHLAQWIETLAWRDVAIHPLLGKGG